jgi:Glycosyltransferase Family 4
VRLLALDLGASLRGGQKQTALLLAELAGRGHAIRFIGRRAAPLAECLRNRGIDVVEAPPGPEASPGLLLAVARAARLFQPDLLYAGDSRGHGAAVWSRASATRPLVVHRRVAFRPSGHPLSRVKYRAADRFLAVSGAVAASLAEAGVDPSRVAVVLSLKTDVCPDCLPRPLVIGPNKLVAECPACGKRRLLYKSVIASRPAGLQTLCRTCSMAKGRAAGRARGSARSTR